MNIIMLLVEGAYCIGGGLLRFFELHMGGVFSKI